MKKLNKFFAVLVALAMMATLCVSMAFAAESPYATAATDAKLTKYLQAGTGVDKPGATYNFNVTSTTPGAAAATNTSIAADAMAIDANGDYIGTLTIAKMFEGATWTKAGEFVYTVTEAAVSNYNEDADANDTLTIDENATYTLRVYIKNTDDGLVIDKVTVQKGADKVDPNPENPPETADEGKDKGFSFTNTYTKQLDDNNNQDNKGLIDLTKTVKGDYGDKTYKFPFELTYTLPQANPNAAVKYKVLKDGATEAAAEEKTAENGKIEVTLGHGDKLIITEAPQGLSWATEEKIASATDLQNYDKYSTTANGAEGTTTAATILSTTGEAAYVNTLNNQDVTPTGILMSNLPYIALALVAIGGLVAYVVVRRRNADEA